LIFSTKAWFSPRKEVQYVSAASVSALVVSLDSDLGASGLGVDKEPKEEDVDAKGAVVAGLDVPNPVNDGLVSVEGAGASVLGGAPKPVNPAKRGVCIDVI
jgi:hypothetical protein